MLILIQGWGCCAFDYVFFTGLNVGQLKEEEEKLKTEIFKEDKKDLGKITSFGAVGIFLHVLLLLAKNIYKKQITIEKAQSAKGDSARNRQMVLRADSRKGRGSHSQSFVVLYLYFFNQPFQGSFSFSVFKQLLFPLSNTLKIALFYADIAILAFATPSFIALAY